ncbi:hypothetical protein KVT40_001318 [Elsinoe batatas]|uniref:Uncharacterized protein n=1 Tax=Elsinoe batatas TaxID=2601811 RepID=A0A8K0PLA0_9PEZI|nr:hypothetical protein KVT40_001318 [Elsinoe batatas]
MQLLGQRMAVGDGTSSGLLCRLPSWCRLVHVPPLQFYPAWANTFATCHFQWSSKPLTTTTSLFSSASRTVGGSSKTRPSGGVSRMTGNNTHALRTMEDGRGPATLTDKDDVVVATTAVSVNGHSPKQSSIEEPNGGIMVSHAYTIEEEKE